MALTYDDASTPAFILCFVFCFVFFFLFFFRRALVTHRCSLSGFKNPQVGVIGEKSTRDGRRQTRLIRGTEDSLQIYTINHHTEEAEARLDLTLNYDVSSGVRVPVFALHFPSRPHFPDSNASNVQFCFRFPLGSLP